VGTFYTSYILVRRNTRPRIYMRPPPFLLQIKEQIMLDAILIAAGFGFFVVAIAYTVACARL
jgi:hypothetical protein